MIEYSEHSESGAGSADRRWVVVRCCDVEGGKLMVDGWMRVRERRAARRPEDHLHRRVATTDMWVTCGTNNGPWL